MQTKIKEAQNAVADYDTQIEELKQSQIGVYYEEQFERAAEKGNEYASDFLKKMNDGKNASFRLGHRRAMILSNATRALKKALKEEWQKRQNEKEHEKLVEESIDI